MATPLAIIGESAQSADFVQSSRDEMGRERLGQLVKVELIKTCLCYIMRSCNAAGPVISQCFSSIRQSKPQSCLIRFVIYYLRKRKLFGDIGIIPVLPVLAHS